jgi:hypothetical protein
MTNCDPIPAGVCYREGPITDADYVEAIEDLQRAREQAKVLHICCSICEDTGHSAASCHHNPLILARQWAAATKVWNCYHCGFVATNDVEAREHFGASDQEPAACLVKQVEAAGWARKRLEDFADKANAGDIHYSARELKRRIWAAFADFDAAGAVGENVQPTGGNDGVA